MHQPAIPIKAAIVATKVINPIKFLSKYSPMVNRIEKYNNVKYKVPNNSRETEVFKPACNPETILTPSQIKTPQSIGLNQIFFG